MSSLGKLISGIAHEINTPLGNCITTTSYIGKETEHIAQKYKNGMIQKWILKILSML